MEVYLYIDNKSQIYKHNMQCTYLLLIQELKFLQVVHIREVHTLNKK